MQNISDYLDWRGDIGFERDGLNEVDNLILSTLAYLDFEDIVPSESVPESVLLSEAAEAASQQPGRFAEFGKYPFFKQIPSLLYKAAETKRYSDIRMSRYTNKIDPNESVQFSAIVFSINADLHFIAFRGTDDTITGWKEDFQMSFLDESPSQRYAVIYARAVFSQLPGKFFLGGHSKGGNLAVYASSHVDKEAVDRIITIYNNDGPGFQSGVIESEGYKQIVDKVHSFLPKESVIGLLLEHRERYDIVSSKNKLLLQHDTFSWDVKGTRFVYDKGISKTSLTMRNTIRSWVQGLTLEQRKEFVHALFDIIQATNARSLGDLSKVNLASSVAMMKSLAAMDIRTRLHLMNTISLFFKESGRSINKSIMAEIESLLGKKS